MRQTRAFFVPDYYERFICKADTCRANCCHGWCITVSMQDYFNLLSVPCSKRLRDKLDVSLHVVKNPYSQRHESVWDEYTAICALYASLRALTIGCLAESENMEDFVDVCAAAFKLFDHSGFDHNVMVFLRQIGLCDERAMRVLCVC